MLRLLKEILLSNLLWESLVLSFVVCNMNEKLKKEIDEMKELDIFQYMLLKLAKSIDSCNAETAELSMNLNAINKKAVLTIKLTDL